MSLITDALRTAQREKARRTPKARQAESGRSFLSLRSSGGAGFGKMSSPMMLASALLAGMFAVLVAVVVITSLRKKNDRTLASAPTPLAIPAGAAASEPAPALFGTAPPAEEIVESSVPFADGELSTRPYANPRYAEDALPAPVAPAASESAELAEAPVQASAEASEGAPTTAGPAIVRPAPAAGGLAVATPSARATPIRPGALTITMEKPVGQGANPYVQQALAAQRRGDLVNAQELYTKAIALSPNNAELRNNVGALYRSLGKLEQAEEAYRRAIALDRTLASAWSNLGVVLEARGQGRDATAAFQEAMRLDPANPATKVNLAILYHASGLLPNARILLEEAIRKDPGMSEAHYALARLLESQGQRAGAVRQYNLFLTTSAGRFPELEELVQRHINQLTANAG